MLSKERKQTVTGPFRADLDVEFDSVSAMGEVAGTPPGKITDKMRQMGNKLWGHPEADEAL